MVGYKLVSFMNAYFMYNQIPMHKEDRYKTTFMKEKTNYWYNIMAVSLKKYGCDIPKND